MKEYKENIVRDWDTRQTAWFFRSIANCSFRPDNDARSFFSQISFISTTVPANERHCQKLYGITQS